jgi:hypothetical protein
MEISPKPASEDASIDAEALALSAQFVNHVQVTTYGAGLVRLSFGEAPTPNAAVYRTAIVMTLADARQLLQEVLKVLDRAGPPLSPGRRPN